VKLPGLGEPTKAGPASLSLRAAVAIWALAVLVFWWPCLVGPMAPLLGDAQANMLPWRAASPPPPNPRWDALLWDGMAQYYPWRAFAARMARQGLIPLWNPHQFCGTPFVANGQSAFFYPPNWLFYLLDVRYAFGLTAALHYFLAGCFMLLLARELGLRPSAGLVGAAAFSFGGFMVSWTALPTLMNTAAWLPGVVWSIEHAFRRKTPADGLLIGGMLAMCLLAGHLQIAAYVWLTAGLHALARAAWAAKRRQPARLAHLAAGVSLAVALGLGQLLPTLELAQRSPRGNATPTEEGFQFRRVRALQPVMLRTLLLPDTLGTPDDWARSGLAYSEVCGYVGRLTLVLAICALVGLRSRKAFWFGGLALFALLGAMGTFVARVLYFHFPGLGQAGGFGRLLCVYTFAVAVLGAMGAEWLVSALGRSRSSLLAAQVAPLAPLMAALLIAVEVGTWGRGFLPLSPRTRVYPATELTRRLVDFCRNGDRVLAVTRRDAWTINRLPGALLPPNAATAYGYNDVQGYDSLYPATYAEYASSLAPDGYTPITNGNMVLVDDPSAIGLNGAAVRWVVLAADAPAPGAALVERLRSDGCVLYENLAAKRQLSGADTGRGSEAEAPLDSTGDPAQVAARAGPGQSVVAVQRTIWPGWQTFAGGRPAVATRHGSLTTMVRVANGAERVEMVYRPASFAVGAFLSLVALSVMAGWVACARGRNRGRADVEETRPGD
jgi:hypothetical protein